MPSQLETLRAAPGGSKLVGIRHVTTMEADEAWLARPAVARGLKALAAAGVPFDVVVRPWQLPLVADLARTLNTSRFVLDHLGKPALASSSLDGVVQRTSRASLPTRTSSRRSPA